MNNAQVKKMRGSSNPSGEPSTSKSRRGRLVAVIVAAGLGVLGIFLVGVAKAKKESPTSSIAVGRSIGLMAEGISPVFTPAHRSFVDALREFFSLQSAPVQPIAFNHKIHIQNGLQCADCHTGVTQGSNAGIPSVSFCMACHQVIAASNPEIKKLTAYVAKGQDVPWQRVYWFYPEMHVRFQHAPHIRNGIACEQCHGDMSKQTVAVRTTDLTMNFCLSCHRSKGVSVDCITCHY
jgi:cytochrome c7-like protein